jgi:tyrosine-protein phosphatase non-receptor type 23
LIQIKAKYFTSLSQYYRAQTDESSGKHGDALVRFTIAETTAKECNRIATSFNSSFLTQLSPTLPADAGFAISERTKAHLAVCTERRAEASRENDLIYNAVLPAPEALPPPERIPGVAKPVPIQEVYGTPEVQKVIGQDIFIKLVPLSVHESASVYSEEKAKLVRAEAERAEVAEGEVRSALDALGVREGLARYKAIVDEGEGGQQQDPVPTEVRRWRDDIETVERTEGVETLLATLARLKESVRRELQEGVAAELDAESRECEAMRVKYDHLWTQEPSAGPSRQLRQDLKANLTALEAAGQSDAQVHALWESVQGEIRVLLTPSMLEDVFREGGQLQQESLLDIDTGESEQERARISTLVNQIEERLGRLNKIGHERSEVLKDLKAAVSLLFHANDRRI